MGARPRLVSSLQVASSSTQTRGRNFSLFISLLLLGGTALGERLDARRDGARDASDVEGAVELSLGKVWKVLEDFSSCGLELFGDELGDFDEIEVVETGGGGAASGTLDGG